MKLLELVALAAVANTENNKDKGLLVIILMVKLNQSILETCMDTKKWKNFDSKTGKEMGLDM